jgi:CheY-like chemotaxis protein
MGGVVTRGQLLHLGTVAYQALRISVRAEANMSSSQDTSADSHQSLIDNRMPGMNGRELFNRVRDVEDIRAHVVFVTGDALDPGTQAFIRETGLPYLPKPFEVVDLLAVIEGD